ncbi:hypothetical protein ASG73_16340 [Janibacter sp. Soil728]|uniref:O-antigen ligase family protein n=1 Tax=Janibacter sp. Soil728 TaxID=1736393 RepID=UPI0006FE7FF4|nr:O-antigen ligase family protein [Janibacter sp. Soil728]KRE35503.1 hypothetical protein ASG73_16340 [Janibacter sp. Soil728]
MLCAVPPATNVGPGQVGYLLALIVLVGVLAWALLEDTHRSLLSRRQTVPLVLFGGWLAVSLLRSGPWWETATVATLLAVLAAAAPWSLARVQARESTAERVTLVMAASVLGSAVAAWIVPLVLGEGLHWRQALPIGGASNSAVGLTLALAGTLTGERLHPDRTWLWRGLSVVTGLLVVQSLSRAAWFLALVLVVVALAARRRHIPGWLGPVAGLLVVAVVGLLARQRGVDLIIDRKRWDNANTGLEAWSDSWVSVIVGLGPSRMWPWLGLERGHPVGDDRAAFYHDSPWGTVLHHAHSTYLEVLVEYGLVGLLLFIAVLAVVMSRCVREIRQRGVLSLLAVAVLLALPAMLVELYLLRGFPSAVLFWTAVFAVGGGGGFEARPSARWHVRRNRGRLI